MSVEVLKGKIESIEQIVDKYEETREYEVIKKDICKVKNKISDDCLYLGVVGSFSSGKSTFINSIIGKSILPTDAVQGTTVTSSVLKKASIDDVEIKYSDGSVAKYSTDFDVLCERYAMPPCEADSDNDKGFLIRFLDFIKKILGIGKKKRQEEETKRKQKHIRDFYRYIVSTEKVATDIESATLYIDNKNMEYNIALVDTPGTESLNSRHTEVTKNAIDSICDALIVIIPYDEPVSENLVAYIQKNIENYKKKCIFAVTKVELLDDQDELPGLLEWITKKLEDRLEIESPVVIPMATFLHLKEVDDELTTSFLDEINEDTKTILLNMYEEGVQVLTKVLRERRELFISENLAVICNRVISSMKEQLNQLIEENEQENIDLTKESVIDLGDFIEEEENIIREFVEEKSKSINVGWTEVMNCNGQFFDAIIEQIVSCNDSSALIEEIGQQDFDQLFKGIQEVAVKMEKKYEEDKQFLFKQIEKKYYEAYQQCGVVGNISAQKVFVNLEAVQVAIEYISVEFDNLMNTNNELIKQSRKGLFKKVKNLFSNPSDNQIEIVKNDMQELYDLANTVLEETWQIVCQNFFLDLEYNIQEAFRDMIQQDESNINDYISRNTIAISDNLRIRDELIKDLSIVESQI